MKLTRAERAGLEQTLTQAFRLCVPLPSSERLAFVAKHLLAEAPSQEPPAASLAVAAGGKQRTAVERQALLRELAFLAKTVTSILNATADSERMGGRHVHTVLAEALLRHRNAAPSTAPTTPVAAPAALKRSKSSIARARLSPFVLRDWGKWEHSFIQSDPRHQILEFFQPGDERGPNGVLQSLGERPSGTTHTTYFSVWRPTSLDAIRMMMSGRATGKGLNIKGKSAKEGKLSGFVPYLQISDEKHKRKLGVSPADATARVFYPSHAARAAARVHLQQIMDEMKTAADAALLALEEEERSGVALDDEIKEGHLDRLTRWRLERYSLDDLDEAGYGIDVPERLLVEAYILRGDISHPGNCTQRLQL